MKLEFKDGLKFDFLDSNTRCSKCLQRFSAGDTAVGQLIGSTFSWEHKTCPMKKLKVIQ